MTRKSKETIKLEFRISQGLLTAGWGLLDKKELKWSSLKVKDFYLSINPGQNISKFAMLCEIKKQMLEACLLWDYNDKSWSNKQKKKTQENKIPSFICY